MAWLLSIARDVIMKSLHLEQLSIVVIVVQKWRMDEETVVDFEWLMDLYGDDWPEEVQNYKIPLADIRRNIVNAPYITLREDEVAEFETVRQFGNWKRVECSMCHNNIGDIGDSECPYCGRKIMRFDDVWLQKEEL